MTTVQDIIEEARYHLLGNHLTRRNTLASGITSSSPALALNFEDTISPNTRLSIGYEDVLTLIAMTGAGSSINVVRGLDGSTAAAHNASDLVWVNPIYSDWQLFRQVNNTLKKLSGAGLYQVKNIDLTYNSQQIGYDLGVGADDLLSVLSVRYDTPGPENDWPRLLPNEYSVDLNPDNVDFLGPQLNVGRGFPGRKIRVQYRAGFTPLPAVPSTDITVSGLPESASDLLALGTAINAHMGREVKRSFLDRQPEPRKQSEVPPGTALQAVRGLLAEYDTRFNQELARLQSKYGA